MQLKLLSSLETWIMLRLKRLSSGLIRAKLLAQMVLMHTSTKYVGLLLQKMLLMQSKTSSSIVASSKGRLKMLS